MSRRSGACWTGSRTGSRRTVHSHPARVLAQHEPWIGDRAGAAGGVAGDLVLCRIRICRGPLWCRGLSAVRPGLGLGGLDLKVSRPHLEMALSAPERLGHGPPQLARQVEPGDRKHDERRSPSEQARREAADDVTKGEPSRLADQDVGPDPPALVGGEVVAGERRDPRTRGRRDRPQSQPREQERREAGGECAG